MAAPCAALGGAIAAEAATVRHGGAREIVLLIQDFLASAWAGELLDAMRTDRDVDGDVVDALKAAARPIQSGLDLESATCGAQAYPEMSAQGSLAS